MKDSIPLFLKKEEKDSIPSPSYPQGLVGQIARSCIFEPREY
jgi:hypothetical protein